MCLKYLRNCGSNTSVIVGQTGAAVTVDNTVMAQRIGILLFSDFQVCFGRFRGNHCLLTYDVINHSLLTYDVINHCSLRYDVINHCSLRYDVINHCLPALATKLVGCVSLVPVKRLHQSLASHKR